MQPEAITSIAEHSAETIKKGSQSFALASLLFPTGMRQDAQMLYAWCRYCDDVIDGQVLGQGVVTPDKPIAERLDWLKQQTDAALQGKPVTEPAFVALQHVAISHSIKHDYFYDLLEGFRMDAEGKNYETFEDTLLYSYHVAGVVGVMMARIMGVSEDERLVLQRASDLGVAFQLTNIARDVIQDAENGRVYLPQDWLESVGLPHRPAELVGLEHREALYVLALRLLDAAEPYYASARIGVASLPPRAAMAIEAARLIYRQIGIVIQRQGVIAWSRRASTGKATKLGLAISGGAKGWRRAALSQPEKVSREGLWTAPRLR